MEGFAKDSSYNHGWLFESEGSLWDKISFADLDNLNDTNGASDGEDLTTLYRVAFQDQVPNIFKYGYNRAFTGTKGGNMYGPGVYCTFRLEDSIYNCKTKPEYGNCIIKMKLIDGFKNFIIFDERLARKVYGNSWRISDQLQNVAKLSRDEAKNLERQLSYQSDLYHGRTAPAALRLWHSYDSSIFKNHGVRGLIYKGNRDGHCALPYDFSSVIPYSVSTDYGKTFKKRLTERLFNYLVDHPDVDFTIGGSFKGVFGSVRGFTIVSNRANKYNIATSRKGETISPVWFDDVKGQINPRTGTFGFTYKGFDFNGTIDTPEGGTETGCVLDPYMQPYCYFSDLDDLVAAMREAGAKTLQEFIVMESESKLVSESVRGSVRNLVSRYGFRISESVRKSKRIVHDLVSRHCLSEDRTVDDKGVVTVDNFDLVRTFMDPESDDDVWFVKIVQRHKDTPNIRGAGNACDNYLKYYLLHGEKDLNENEDEIKTICRAMNARAYINMNKRSLVSLTDYANNVLKPRFRRHNNRQYMGHEIEVAAGQAKDQGFPERKLCFLDIDSDDERVYRKVMAMLDKAGIKPIGEYRSMNNGWHILLPDKERARGLDFSSIDNGYHFGRFSTAGLEIDRPILLYASLSPKGYGVQKRVQAHKRRKQSKN